MSDQKTTISVEGLFYAFAAFIWWGFVPPIYFSSLMEIPVWEVLAHRIFWTLPFLAVVLAMSGKLHQVVKAVGTWNILRGLLITTLFISFNWYAYVYGVTSRQVVQTSLGYFMNPLVNVVFGLLFFGERLRTIQWFAVALAAIGVIRLTSITGELPWIALTLAFSFGIYGVLRKTIPVDGLVGLSVEILLVSPLALGYMLFLGFSGQAEFASGNWHIDVLLILSAVITAVPLLCFGQAARKLPLTTLGFIQYLSPTLQFLTAIVWLEEPMNLDRFYCFCFIWVGLLFYSIDSVYQYRQRKNAGKQEVAIMVESER